MTPAQTSLYDLAPLAQMALLAALLASGPLLWLWMRHRGTAIEVRLQALAVLTLFLTFDLVLFGAFTRLTDSGLGCPDWPGCYGSASPLGAREEIHAAQSTLPTGPVTHGKAWVEMIHRYLASSVGLLIAVLMFASWWAWWAAHRAQPQDTARRSIQRSIAGWATAAFVWVCVQGAFGALTVTMKLYPAIVTAHLLGGLLLLVLLAVLVQQHGRQPVLALRPRLRAAVGAVLMLVTLQVALGGWVSTNYAVLACQDFPTCQGSWWPDMDFAQGFTLQRELGAGRDGGYLPFAALTAIHYAHRLVAYAVLAALMVLAWKLYRSGDDRSRRFAMGLAAMALWQLASGASNVVLGWPLVAALAHTGGAAGMVVLLSTLLARSHSVEPAGLPSHRSNVATSAPSHV